jgi:hypothetical protein
MNAILAADLRSPVNNAVIVNHDYRLFSLLLWRNTQPQAGILFDPYPIA